MTENGGRRHLPPERKFEIVKEVIMGKAHVSEVCRKHGISTALYYKWQQVFFHGALEGLTHRKRNGQGSRKEERLAAENQRLKEIIAEIASENLQLKKKSWGIEGHVEDEGLMEKIKAEVERMKEKTGLSLGWILRQLGIGRSTYYRWEGWRRPEKRGFVHPLKPWKRAEEAGWPMLRGIQG